MASDFIKLFWSFFKIGFFTFGGGLAMIPFIEDEFVSKKKWLSADEMRELVILSQTLPESLPLPRSGRQAVSVPPVSGLRSRTPTFSGPETLSAPHCFTTRLGGVSEGYLRSLNLGMSRGDDPENVRKNYAILGEFVTMLVKALDIPVDEDVTQTGYTDDIPLWLQPYLAAAVRSGLTDGLENQQVFEADSPITAAEADVLLKNALNREESCITSEELPMTRAQVAF